MLSSKFLSVSLSALVLVLINSRVQLPAEEAEPGVPDFKLIPAPYLKLPGAIDSNSPSFWQFVEGQNQLHVLTSWWKASISSGFSLRRLGEAQSIQFVNSTADSRWMEAVLQDDNGVLYGYYHNEPVGLCGSVSKKTAPRIGAARSFDDGASWEDLGSVLEFPPETLNCGTPNHYFAGGVGDISVVLDHDKTDAYFFFSIYTGDASQQGVAIGRMLWALRDTPMGNVALWNNGTWRHSIRGRPYIRRRYYEASPIYPAAVSWHHPSGIVDAFWGPSVHWNTSIRQHVMLLNRAADSEFGQEGVYIAFSPVLDKPEQWTQPVKLMEGGNWYPQVMGLERGQGTDKVAGAVSRFFLRGESEHYLVFRTRY